VADRSQVLLQAEEICGGAKQIFDILSRQTLSGLEHLYRIGKSAVRMRIVATDHWPFGADAIDDIR